MWEIPLGGFHLSNDVLHLSHKVDVGPFTRIITGVNTGQETRVFPLTGGGCVAVNLMICCVK